MKILFFTPFSKRNGAEMMLWYLIKYANRKNISSAVYSFHEGELLSELPGDVPYFVPIIIPNLALGQRLAKRAKKYIFSEDYKQPTQNEHILKVHKEFGADLWYINTILCPGVVELAQEFNIPYVVHFHELISLYQNVTYQYLKTTIEKASLLIGCSQAVCKAIKTMGGDKVALQYECVDIDRIQAQVENNTLNQIDRIKFDIGDEVFIWVMSGSVEYRKGADLIPTIAKALGTKVLILWLGPGSSGYSFFIEQELKSNNINNVVFLGPKMEDYYKYLALADGLLLTSREDPFPLVMIEAAALGKPIAAFNSGGVEEFVKDGMGIVTYSNNVEDLIDAMKIIMYNKDSFSKKKSMLRAKDFDAKIQAHLWEKLVLNFFQ